MTKKLEQIFGFDKLEEETIAEPISESLTTEEVQTAIVSVDEKIDKIDLALAGVSDLNASDKEFDEIASLGTTAFKDLTDLGFNVDSRYSAELFGAAGTMLGHALAAKTAKLNKKLKVIELQLKKAKLDQDALKLKGGNSSAAIPTAEGQILTRNDLFDRLMKSNQQNNHNQQNDNLDK